MAFLAAWVLGRRFGIGHLTVGLTALVFASPLTAATQPGSALNDTAAIALVLASIALLAHDSRGPGVIAVAGLAAGLAVGTKLSMIATVLALTGVVLLRRGRRGSTAVIWTAAMAAGGGYWFMRNLVRTGSPMPALAIPGLPSVQLPVIQMYGRSVSDYADNGHFWNTVVLNGFRQVFGSTYPVVILLTGAGLVLGVAAVVRSPPRFEDAVDAAATRRVSVMLVLTALVAGGAYTITPASAYGPPGNPYLFGASVRYAFPALLAGLLLLAIATVGRRSIWGAILAGVIVGIIAVELHTAIPGAPSPLSSRPRAFVVISVLWAAGTALAYRRPELALGRLRAGAFAIMAAGLMAVAGYQVVNPYLHHRYTDGRIWAWARTVHHARIAVVGYSYQYPLFGLDLSNKVQYFAKRGRGGSFVSYRDCTPFESALHAGRYDFLVAGTEKWGVESAPERQWVKSDPAATRILDERIGDLETTLFQIHRTFANPQAVLCK
jgi:hypothetical protein